MSTTKLLATLASLCFALAAVGSTGPSLRPRNATVHPTTPNAHAHTVRAHVHDSRAHHTH
jgi:hypothetical protein